MLVSLYTISRYRDAAPVSKGRICKIKSKIVLRYRLRTRRFCCLNIVTGSKRFHSNYARKSSVLSRISRSRAERDWTTVPKRSKPARGACGDRLETAAGRRQRGEALEGIPEILPIKERALRTRGCSYKRARKCSTSSQNTDQPRPITSMFSISNFC